MALVAGLIVVLVLGGGLYWWSRSSHGAVPGAPVSLPMGPDEQAYSSQIQFTDVQLSRASNMLEQEITYVDGTISNNGPRAVAEIEVSLEFHDLSQTWSSAKRGACTERALNAACARRKARIPVCL